MKSWKETKRIDGFYLKKHFKISPANLHDSSQNGIASDDDCGDDGDDDEENKRTGESVLHS